MAVEVFGPCLLVEDVPASARFYIQHFGFQPRVELDWFTTLSHQDRPYELAFVRADHDTVPEGYRGRRTQGLIIGLLVPDAAAVDARLRAAGVRVMLPLRDEPFGQRHVMVADPNGVLVDVVQPIPADPDWLARHGPDHAGDPAEGARGDSVYVPKVLFGREQFNVGLSWTELAPLLPGWQISGCPSGELAAYVDSVDVVCPFGAKISAEVIARGRFGLIQQYGVGLDRVAVDAATEAGVWVCRLPGDQTGNADSVAELAVLQVLALLRRLDEARAALADGRWGQPVGQSLLGTTTVLVGLGAIGTAVARRLAGFGTRLIGVRAHPERGGPDVVERVVDPDALLDVLAEADVVICSAMGSADTRHLFGRRAFTAVKPGVIFVNVARGSLVDESALLDALDSGRVAAAGLDVYAVEPADAAHPLLAHARVLATPHIAGLTDVMFRRSGELFAANLTRWWHGETPRWAVNRPPVPRRPGYRHPPDDQGTGSVGGCASARTDARRSS